MAGKANRKDKSSVKIRRGTKWGRSCAGRSFLRVWNPRGRENVIKSSVSEGGEHSQGTECYLQVDTTAAWTYSRGQAPGMMKNIWWWWGGRMCPSTATWWTPAGPGSTSPCPWGRSRTTVRCTGWGWHLQIAVLTMGQGRAVSVLRMTRLEQGWRSGKR